MSERTYTTNISLTGVYCVGVISCWYHSVGFWMGLFWPWYIGSVFAGIGQ